MKTRTPATKKATQPETAIASAVRETLAEPKIREAFHEEIRRAFCRGAFLVIEEMKSGTVKTQPSIYPATLDKLASLSGEIGAPIDYLASIMLDHGLEEIAAGRLTVKPVTGNMEGRAAR